MIVGHVVPVSVYYRVFAVLLLLTAVTVAVSFTDLGDGNAIIALTIAMVKALLVVLFFMHIRYSNRLTWVVIAAGVFWLAVLITLTMGDELTRGWLNPIQR